MDIAATATAAAAAAAAVHPSPSPSPPPPPRAPRTVAWLVCTQLAWAAADAVICLFLASMWLLFWALATLEVGRLACGEGCAVVTAAYKVISVAAWVTVVLVCPFIVLQLMMMTASAQQAAAAAATTTATDTEATKEPAPERSSYAAMRQILCDSFFLGLIAAWAFTLLMLIGDLVKGASPVMGSRQERMGSLIYNVGTLGTDMVYCFVVCPIMTVRTWKAWMKTRLAL